MSHDGRPTNRSECSPTATDTVEDDGDEQQRFDAILEQDPNSLDRTETVATSESSPEAWGSNESGADAEQAVNENNADKDLRVHLQHAIDALQEVEQAL